MNRTLIIAEAGVNHNGDIELAKKLIDVAAKSRVDYVKFQTFKAEKLVSKKAKKAAYQIESTQNKEESQFEMIKKLELNKSAHEILIAYCKKRKIQFLSTAFDLESIDLLDELGIDLYKIPSGELTNKPFLEKVASKGKPIILSTGMATLAEVEAATAVLLSNGAVRQDLIILHCNTEYPTPMKDVNLSAMLTIKNKLNVDIGYSDHTLGIEIPIAAVALGAICIEKHFTLDRNMAGPDHRASLEPNELRAMVNSIRNIEKAMGNGIKTPSISEKKNIAIARKSIHTGQDLLKGHLLKYEDLEMRRPGTGISPMEIDKVIGKTLLKSLESDHLLAYKDFS